MACIHRVFYIGLDETQKRGRRGEENTRKLKAQVLNTCKIRGKIKELEE